MNVHPIIRQIIDRDCHVSMTSRQVVRHVISKLRDGYATFRELPRKDRRDFIEDCIKQHRANFELYRSVMNGTSTQRSAHTRSATSEPVLPPGRLSAKAVQHLMRKHRVTIAELSYRTGITQRRIREVRERGLENPMAVRDWIQAITGTDPGPLPERYRIQNPTEETTCGFCGAPLLVGDHAFEYLNEVFCSRHCCRRSRGWD
jgi:hypothetical protein